VAVARIAHDDAADVPTCSDLRLLDCPNLVTRSLAKGSWVVEAKRDVADLGPEAPLDSCGLLEGSTVLDSTRLHLDAFQRNADIEALSLSGVVQSTSATSVSLRCAEAAGREAAGSGRAHRGVAGDEHRRRLRTL
jgi:hypothetical protein